jgi:hypothetical protein
VLLFSPALHEKRAAAEDAEAHFLGLLSKALGVQTLDSTIQPKASQSIVLEKSPHG